MNVRTLALTAIASSGFLGCIGAPSPLAPGVHGSIGLPHRGSLTGGASLPNKGPGFERFRKHHVRWGNPRLVAAIRAAAGDVAKARPGGAPLLIGDLSTESGGFSPGHRSHRNGRDADLILYALTPDGRSIRTPGFINYGPDGLASHEGKFYRLDVERTWLLVKGLITAPGADIQWLFVAAWLEALLIEHARARGESDTLVHRAESVLLQPGDSTPHADHLHVRLACTPDELVAGCYGGGPRWRWLAPMPQLAPVSDQELLVSLIGDLLPPDVLAQLTAPAPGLPGGPALTPLPILTNPPANPTLAPLPTLAPPPTLVPASALPAGPAVADPSTTSDASGESPGSTDAP